MVKGERIYLFSQRHCPIRYPPSTFPSVRRPCCPMLYGFWRLPEDIEVNVEAEGANYF
ncbi:hypothetical protein SAMN05216288_3198 [Pseudomonas punonensis]|uniref:Uncharacterized protein n=1 Tax=Phytopseudomonas punonensis TaxID=1220495 RepID=A0A1M7GJ41_9GAMM|nr:hypothetical protein SAMN05216288_3198 [Pseudomonas punonensis]